MPSSRSIGSSRRTLREGWWTAGKPGSMERGGHEKIRGGRGGLHGGVVFLGPRRRGGAGGQDRAQGLSEKGRRVRPQGACESGRRLPEVPPYEQAGGRGEVLRLPYGQGG